MKDQPNLLLFLYRSATGKYLKLRHRVEKAVQSGRFQKFSRKKKSVLVHRLRKFEQRIKKLYWELKLAAAGTAAVLGLSFINPANAQTSNLGPFVEQPRHLNPLRGPVDNGNYPSIAAVDIDNDGDYDVVLGDYSGVTNGANFILLRNEGTKTSPVFVEDEDFFSGLVINSNDVYPAFADIDEDGDMDLFAGQRQRFSYGASNGKIQYFRNDDGVFSEQTGPWNPGVEPETGNPFYSFDFGIDSNVSPFFVDFDNDDDIDVVIGLNQEVVLYLNDGDGNFSSSVITLDGTLTDDLITPALADMDDDGDVDMVLGSETKYGLTNPLKYYRQISPGNFEEQSGIWDPVGKTGNPFDDISPGQSVSVAFINLDEDPDTDPDADLDLIAVTVDDPLILYFENEGASVFDDRDDTDSPFEGVNVTTYALPVLIDVDGDTDLDAVIGNKYDQDGGGYPARLHYYRNDEGNFNFVTDEDDPFDGITLSTYSYFTPLFADIDGDSDMDLISANYNGNIFLYRNDNGEYTEDTETNPFDGISVSPLPVPRLVDIDKDLDLDLFVSDRNGEVFYFKNTGNAQNPVYEQQLGPLNPLESVTLLTDGTYMFSDLDHDDDYDFIGFATDSEDVENEIVGFYENTGTPQSPVFSLTNFDLLGGAGGNMLISAFNDYDQDGDLDLFFGSVDGTVSYFLNENPPPELTNNTGIFELELIPDANPVICNDFGLDDPDNDAYVEAIIKILNYEQGRDFLEMAVDYSESFASVGFNPTTGEYHLIADLATTTTSDFENALGAITYQFVDTEGEFGRSRNAARSLTKTIRFEVFDTDRTTPIPLDFVFAYANDAPQLGSTASDVSYTAPSSTVEINNTITITDVDDLTMASATISITNFQPGQDDLIFANQNGINGIFSTGTGVLTLTGSASIADYETALRSVRYRNGTSIPVTTPRTISFVVNDGEDNSAPEELDINFNFDPELQASSLTVSYGGAPVNVDNAINVTDVGDAISNASIYFSSGYQNGEDMLTASPPAGITASFNAAAGAMVLNGPANRADFEAALRSITYSNVSGSPTTGPRIIEIFIVDDLGQASNAVYITVNYSAQTPPVLSSSSSVVAYTSGQLIVNSTIAVSDPDDTNLESATVSISSGFVATEDVLSFTPGGGITGSYSAATGVLTLSGSATLADYQTVLRSVTYENINTGDRNKGLRNIVFQVNDGSDPSNAVGTNLSLPNQVPVVANSSVAPAYVSGSIVIADQITLSDGDNATFQAATIQISAGFQSAEDELIFADQNNITGSYDASTGVLSIGGSSSTANYQAALRSVQYRNNNTGDRNKTTRVFTFSVHDGVIISNTTDASVTLPNQVPAVANSGSPPLVGFSSVPVADQLTLTDNDNATFQSASMIITTGLAPLEDQLLFTDQNGITGTYTAATGTLQLNGSASKADYQAALRSVLYQNTSSTPSEAPRIISILVNDGLNNSTASTVTLNINRPPAITDPNTNGSAGGQVTIDVASIVDDPDNNIDLNNISSITITAQPTSGAAASVVNGNLVIDYSVSFDTENFMGTDHLTITVCDVLGRCTTQELTIEISAELVVYNAIAPNGHELNRYLLLRYINPQNRVSIYNRWGDKVFNVENYDNNDSAKRFVGLNNNGNELPSGTYFYKIEYTDGKIFTGYLALKR